MTTQNKRLFCKQPAFICANYFRNLCHEIEMSNLSGYDSEAVGFDSISLNKPPETSSSTQTTEFAESGVASQTNLSKSCGSMITPEEQNAQKDIVKEYSPSGLNDFLKKVVPAMLDQLNQKDKDLLYNSSDSDDEDIVIAKLVQELKVAVTGIGAGDQANSVLDLSWSSAGNSLAVSIGTSQHENWCTHDGLIRIYTAKRSAADKLVHCMDIAEKNCVTAVKYHPSVAALLAYGTASGEVVLCNLRNNIEDMQLTSPPGCHESKRVSALLWADPPLTNIFLTMHINNTGKRRNAADQVLISSGSDGSVNVWQVNVNMKIFESVVSYSVNGSSRAGAPDISCFDFIKSCPLRPSEEKARDDLFVVGTKSGAIYLCTIKSKRHILDSDAIDPVIKVLDGYTTCVLDVAFNSQKLGTLLTLSIDSELRIYDIAQSYSPVKVLCLDVPTSCTAWLPHNPSFVLLGLATPDAELLRVYNVTSGRAAPVDGLTGTGACVTAVDVNQSGSCRIAAGDSEGAVRVWEWPTRRFRYTPDEIDF